MGFAIAVRRLERTKGKGKTIYVRKSKVYPTEWEANVFLKNWKKKHPIGSISWLILPNRVAARLTRP